MDEDAAIIETILREEGELNGGVLEDHDSGWKTVKYSKRQKKPNADYFRANVGSVVTIGNGADVFGSIEEQAEERRRRVIEAQRAALEAAGVNTGSGSKEYTGESFDDDSDVENAVQGATDGNAGSEAKKPKVKKPKKPKVTVSEAAAKIDAGDLAAFLISISTSYESQQDIQLMRFADYFGRAFASVSSSQFPWMKMLKESTVSKMIDMPLGHISEAVYKAVVDWLDQRSMEALGSFVFWSWDAILAELASHQGTVKSSKKVMPQATLKSQVPMFIVLAMTLRKKPDVLTNLLPILKEDPQYLGQDKLPVTVWVIAQASQGDMVVGLYVWVRVFLPMLSGKSCNPQVRDLILQLVERILSSPKSRQILLNGAVRKGERLVPPQALEVLIRLTFPSPSARIKATERFESIYPALKEVALAGSPGSKAIKLVSQQILTFAIKAAGIPELTKETSNLFIWCLTQNPGCYKLWDNLYLENIEASVAVLKILSDQYKEKSAIDSTLAGLRMALINFRKKNGAALASKEYAAHHSSFKEADKHCKAILKRLSRIGRCLQAMMVVSVAFAVGAVVLSHNIPSVDLKGLVEKLGVL
ncbi:hypothetical protein Nepgr_028136 [Nepenthes gracilis]|uniref:Transmembrane protein n=1 Tax=Nepenthes gracilis TaxID=150966 RepID=A0AAD3Y248_NEPGR|nr:hypothetical protein Nepgr_028136 [Nepenthes gracilis]